MVTTVRTARDLGAIVREQRRRLELPQAELAARIGTNRRWVIDVERGKPGAEVGLILRALEALGLALMVAPAVGTVDRAGEAPTRQRQEPRTPALDIDAVIERARKP